MKQESFKRANDLNLQLLGAEKRGDSEPFKRVIEHEREVIRDPKSTPTDVIRATSKLARRLCVVIEMEPVDRVRPWVEEYLEITDSVREFHETAAQDDELGIRLLAMREIAAVMKGAYELSDEKLSAFPRLRDCADLYCVLRKEEQRQVRLHQ